MMHYSLGTERMDEIKANVSAGKYFPCHKTTGRRHDLEAEHDGWENAPMLDRLLAISKEQACVGGRIWAMQSRYLADTD